MEQALEERFRELWDYAKGQYSLPGNGMVWFESWIDFLKVHGNGDYNLMKPVYECVERMARKTWLVISLDGWVEREVIKEIFEREKG